MNENVSSTGPQERAPEAVVARLHPHARRLFWPSLLLVAVAGATGYFAGSLPEEWMNLTVYAAAAVLVLVGWLLPVLAWLGTHYTITTRRIVLRSGMFVRVRQELLHSRGYDVTVRQGALQSVFGSGDIEINTGLEHPVVLRDAPGADLVQSALHDLMERSINPVAARRQQSQSAPHDETTRWGVR